MKDNFKSAISMERVGHIRAHRIGLRTATVIFGFSAFGAVGAESDNSLIGSIPISGVCAAAAQATLAEFRWQGRHTPEILMLPNRLSADSGRSRTHGRTAGVDPIRAIRDLARRKAGSAGLGLTAGVPSHQNDTRARPP